jgi:NADPH-dependent curcumin reductase CurA
MTTSPTFNRRVVLAGRPQGKPTSDSFRLEQTPVPEPRPGEVLLRTLWLSLDPYMRGRMSDGPSYAAPVAVGAVMVGGTVARVERSLNPAYQAGDLVLAMSGWQEFAVSNGTDLVKLPADLPHPSHALGVLGMPGITAYVGLVDYGKPQPGETVVVAAATGAVGSVVGQIGKIKGCRVVGIAGGTAKCDWAVKELGLDACVDHRSAAFEAELAAACPKGIDVYFENVGGRVLRAVIPLLNAHSRMPVCGLISLYNDTAKPTDGESALAFMRTVLIKRITIRGFIVSDSLAQRSSEALAAIGGWMREGRIRYREDVVHGLPAAPAAFIGLLDGRNFGKLVVDIAGGAA